MRKPGVKTVLTVLVLSCGLSLGGQANARGWHGGGPGVGGLVGAAVVGTLLGVAVGSAVAAPAYAAPAPVVYETPVVAEPVYAPAPAACYDRYYRRYVPCAAPAPGPVYYGPGY